MNAERVTHALDRKLSDRLARAALTNGWRVRRRSAVYFTAERDRGNGVREQVSTWVRNGQLRCTRVEVKQETEHAAQAMAWFSEGGSK